MTASLRPDAGAKLFLHAVPEPAIDTAGLDRVKRLYLRRKRHELLAPVHTMLELLDTLLAEEKLAACDRVARDIRTIRVHTCRMVEIIGTTLQRDEAIAEVAQLLNHDLRNCLTPVLGYGGDLTRLADKFFLDEMHDEFREITSLGRRLLTLVDATVSELRAPEGVAAADSVVRYLDRTAGPMSEGDADPPPSDEPGRILVADDSDGVRELLCDYLRSQGHEATPARDGVEALEQVNAGEFDLIMTDIQMPGINGFQLIENMRADSRVRELPVIVISGHGDLDGITRCLKLGAEDVLPKPFNRMILKARVDACLEKKRLRDRNEQERQRYNDLLNSILPGPVVEELVRTDSVKPQRREGAAVLFADIVGFTTYCDRQQAAPEVVVQHLRRLFEAWEALAEARGVQKIKTIGDAFMASAGLLTDAANPVLDCVQLGLEMIEFTRTLCDDSGQPLGFDLRVGVHCGTVVSGVLGRRQSLFDLWGDAVNVAARLESQGQPGCVNLSREAWQHVSRLVTGETRSIRSLKGKPGMTEVIHLAAGEVTLCVRPDTEAPTDPLTSANVCATPAVEAPMAEAETRDDERTLGSALLPDHLPTFRHLDPAAALAFRTPLQEHPPAADTKASATLAALGIMFPLIAKFEKTLSALLAGSSGVSIATYALLIGFSALAVGVVVQAFRTFSPRFPRSTPTLAFFRDIAGLSRDEYIEKMHTLSHHDALAHICLYNHTLSVICVAKFRQLKWAIQLFKAAFCCWLLLMLLLLTHAEVGR